MAHPLTRGSIIRGVWGACAAALLLAGSSSASAAVPYASGSAATLPDTTRPLVLQILDRLLVQTDLLTTNAEVKQAITAGGVQGRLLQGSMPWADNTALKWNGTAWAPVADEGLKWESDAATQDFAKLFLPVCSPNQCLINSGGQLGCADLYSVAGPTGSTGPQGVRGAGYSSKRSCTRPSGTYAHRARWSEPRSIVQEACRHNVPGTVAYREYEHYICQDGTALSTGYTRSALPSNEYAGNGLQQCMQECTVNGRSGIPHGSTWWEPTATETVACTGGQVYYMQMTQYSCNNGVATTTGGPARGALIANTCREYREYTHTSTNAAACRDSGWQGSKLTPPPAATDSYSPSMITTCSDPTQYRPISDRILQDTTNTAANCSLGSPAQQTDRWGITCMNYKANYCPVANGTGVRPWVAGGSWAGSGWGTCTAVFCNAGYRLVNGACVAITTLPTDCGVVDGAFRAAGATWVAGTTPATQACQAANTTGNETRTITTTKTCQADGTVATSTNNPAWDTSACQSICPTGQVRNATTGACEVPACPAGQEMVTIPNNSAVWTLTINPEGACGGMAGAGGGVLTNTCTGIVTNSQVGQSCSSVGQSCEIITCGGNVNNGQERVYSCEAQTPGQVCMNACGANSTRQANGSCTCNVGYEMVNGSCAAACPAGQVRNIITGACEASGGACQMGTTYTYVRTAIERDGTTCIETEYYEYSNGGNTISERAGNTTFACNGNGATDITYAVNPSLVGTTVTEGGQTYQLDSIVCLPEEERSNGRGANPPSTVTAWNVVGVYKLPAGAVGEPTKHRYISGVSGSCNPLNYSAPATISENSCSCGTDVAYATRYYGSGCQSGTPGQMNEQSYTTYNSCGQVIDNVCSY